MRLYLLLVVHALGAPGGNVSSSIPKVNVTADDVTTMFLHDCDREVKRYCAEVNGGAGRIARCLRREVAKQKSKGVLSPTCRASVQLFFVKAASLVPGRNGTRTDKLYQVEPSAGFESACGKDAARHCPGKVNGALTACLKAKKFKVSPNCRSALSRAQMWEAKDMRLDTNFTAACAADLQRITECASIEPGDGRKKKCLWQHRQELTTRCREAFFKKKVEEAEDIRFNAVLSDTCSADIATTCKDAKFGEGRCVKALWERTLDGTAEPLGSRCKESIENVTEEKALDFRLDFRLRTRCATQIDEYCADEKQREEALSVDEIFGKQGGLVITCLKEQQSLSEECQEEVDRIVRVHSWRPMSSPMLNRMCKDDREQFCEGARNTELNQCLREHLKELTAQCAHVVRLQGSLEAGKIAMKPLLAKACAGPLGVCKKKNTAPNDLLSCVRQRIFLKSPVKKSERKCKAMLQQDALASANDFRLMYGYHFDCKADATELCGDIFETGNVMVCLKANHKKIVSNECQSLVKSYVLEDGYNLAACTDDAASLCTDEESVHDCLAKNLPVLSDECRFNEFTDLQMRAQDITMDPDAMKYCQSSIAMFCPQLEEGRGMVWRCLEDNVAKDGMASSCQTVVKDHMLLKHTNYLLNPNVVQSCSGDAELLCFDGMQATDFGRSSVVLDCLIENRQQITDQSCRDGILRKVVQRMEDISNDVFTHAACGDDLLTHCLGEETHTCLQDNLDILSQSCHRAEVAVMKKQTNDFLVNMNMVPCRPDAKKFCDGLPWDKVTGCLLDGLHTKPFSSTCQAALVGEEVQRSKGKEFTPSLRQCDRTLANFRQTKRCKEEDDDLECLTRHSKNITADDCAQAVSKVLKRESNDFRASKAVSKNCQSDIQNVCSHAKAGVGRVHKCLRNHMKDISEKCQKAVAEVKSHESENFLINPLVAKNCVNEKTVFCADITPGKSRVLACLKKHLTEEGFSEPCKEALGDVKIDAASVKEVEGAEASSVQQVLDDLKVFYSKHQSFFDKYGSMVAVILVGWATLVLSILIFIILRRKVKGSYAVVSRNLDV